jgi:hypothetical protein
MEVPNQDDDAFQHSLMDDITQLMTQCELHIPVGNITVIASTDVVSPVDPNNTPVVHGNSIPLGYFRVSMDRVIKDYREVGLYFPRGDGQKTLGQAEHSFIVWRKRYIIIPGAPPRVPSPPPQLPHDRCG